jgi:uncharacterized protein YgiM (DUF1202 family)
LAEFSWFALFAHQYARALDASERSLKLKADLAEETKHAHALMLLGRKDEAKVIYLAHKGEALNDTTWDSEDFGKLRQAGITHPMMADIEQALGTPKPPTRPVQEAALVPQQVPGRPSSSQNSKAAVVSDQLTLRKEADKTAEAIVVLNKGAQVEVISTDSNGWQQVQLTDQGTTFEGYVNGKFLTQDLNASPTPAIVTEPPDLDKPSFCGRETKPIEFVVCSNSDLAFQDGAMGKSYQMLLARSHDPDALKRSQKQWTDDRRQQRAFEWPTK